MIARAALACLCTVVLASLFINPVSMTIIYWWINR
jgi:hypothetical protein